MGIDILYKAIAAECRSVVPELKKIYRDNIPQNADGPFILVLITDTDTRRCLANRQRVKQSFDVQYFPGEELQNRRKECEKVKQEMLQGFDVISADDISFYVKEKNANVTDDVLHLLFSVSYVEYREPAQPKMEELDKNIEVEE